MPTACPSISTVQPATMLPFGSRDSIHARTERSTGLQPAMNPIATISPTTVRTMRSYQARKIKSRGRSPRLSVSGSRNLRDDDGERVWRGGAAGALVADDAHVIHRGRRGGVGDRLRRRARVF